MITEIDTTRATLRNAACLLLDAMERPPTPEQEAEMERTAYALMEICKAAESYAQEREEWIGRHHQQAEAIAELQVELDRVQRQDDEVISEMRAELMHSRERIVYLAAQVKRNEAELQTTRDHLQSALRQRDAAREARATDAAIRKAAR